jgi:hypothetical protein
LPAVVAVVVVVVVIVERIMQFLEGYCGAKNFKRRFIE